MEEKAMSLKGIFNGLLDILYPRNFTCDICNREIFNGDNLCDKCRGTVTVNNGYTCPVCGRKTLSLNLHIHIIRHNQKIIQQEEMALLFPPASSEFHGPFEQQASTYAMK